MNGKTVAVLAILVTVLIALVTWSREERRRQQPLNAGSAPWNRERGAFDLPLDNNSTTIRRGRQATFEAKPTAWAPTGELVSVDQIIFEPRDRKGDLTWRKPIGDISLPANSSAIVNAYVVDPELAGTLLEGYLTIEFAAEEDLQAMRYHMYLTVLRSTSEVPDKP